jgi:hypothetical protein
VNVDWGSLSQDQIQNLVREAWPFLGDERVFELLNEVLSRRQREDIIAAIEACREVIG